MYFFDFTFSLLADFIPFMPLIYFIPKILLLPLWYSFPQLPINKLLLTSVILIKILFQKSIFVLPIVSLSLVSASRFFLLKFCTVQFFFRLPLLPTYKFSSMFCIILIFFKRFFYHLIFVFHGLYFNFRSLFSM